MGSKFGLCCKRRVREEERNNCISIVGLWISLTCTFYSSFVFFFSLPRSICYRSIIKEGLRTEGIRAFLTPAKWGSRVLMNAPAQGTIPWFYNTILPKGEVHVKDGVRAGYTSFNKWRDSGAFNFKM